MRSQDKGAKRIHWLLRNFEAGERLKSEDFMERFGVALNAAQQSLSRYWKRGILKRVAVGEYEVNRLGRTK